MTKTKVLFSVLVLVFVATTTLVLVQYYPLVKLRKAAEQGDASAQYNLGVRYFEGWGIRLDHDQAYKFYRKAAEQGHAHAQYALASIYYHRGMNSLTPYKVPEEAAKSTHDFAEAYKWVSICLDQVTSRKDHANKLMINLKENMTKMQILEGRRLYIKWNADQGYAEAQSNLGVMYAKGQGVPQDYVEAYKWCNLSAAQGNSDAVKNRDILSASMTPEQIAEGQRLSREWKPKK
ncbi:MAG: tetratricopeptide repeat protein [Pseudomonadota bacterium]